MKKKKVLSKILAIVLVLNLMLSVPKNLSVFAQETSIKEKSTEKSELWQPESNTNALSFEGDLSLEELQSAKLSAEDTPEIVSKDSIEENGHVNRLWKQEEDMNSIVFQNRDGTKTMYYYNYPVKYKDANGKIKDKSNKISKTSSGDYTNAGNDINTYFPKKLNSNNGIELKFGEYVVEMAPDIKGNSGASRQTGHNKYFEPTEYVQYPNVFDESISLRYTPTFEGYKEDIVLSKYVGINEFSFHLYTDGLSLVMNEDGVYCLIDPLSGEVKTQIGDLVVYDSKPFEAPDKILNESVSNPTEEDYAKKEAILKEAKKNAAKESSSVVKTYSHQYKVKTVKQDNEYLITIIVDEDYLTDKERVYPVYVDPTLRIDSFEINETKNIMDAPIYSARPNYTHSDNEYNVVGYAGYWKGAEYGTGRTLMKFPGLNSSSTYANLPTNQITSLELHIYEGSGNPGTACIDLWQYTGASWTESTARCGNIGWESYSNNFTWNYVNSSGWQTFDLTSMVETWKGSDSALDKGIMLKNYTSEFTSGYSKHFMSTESGYQPYLTYTYNAITYSTLTLNQSKSGYVEQGGEYWYQFTVPECVNYRFYTRGSIDTYGELYQGSTLVTANDDAGDGTNFAISYTLTEGAVYRLRVRGYSSSTEGSYTLRVVANTSFDSSKTTNLKSEFNTLLGSGKKSVLHHYTPEQCIEIILDNDEHISQLCNTQGFEIPKSFVQSLLMRELWCVNESDDIADKAVKGDVKEDSSTGYGQIFAKTAIGALNNAIELGIYTGMSSMDESSEEDLSTMWNRLHNDQNFNIRMVYYEVLNCANKTSQPNIYLWDYSATQIKSILTRYNGTGDDAVQYGNEVYEYYLIFKEYNEE